MSGSNTSEISTTETKSNDTTTTPLDRTISISETIDYELGPKGQLIKPEGMACIRPPSKKAAAAGQPGSADWTLIKMFGDRDAAIEMIESIVAGQGDDYDDEWWKFCLIYRQWELDYKQGKLDKPPNFNEVLLRLKLTDKQFINRLVVAVKDVSKALGKFKAIQSLPNIVESAIINAHAGPEGFRDRELVLKLGELMEDKSGVNINVNQQMGVNVAGELKSPLKQFTDTATKIDDEVRQDFVEGELLDD